MKKLILTFTLLIAGLATQAQETPDLETYTLRNGLKVYLLKYGKIEAMHVSVVINSGKKNETPGQQGYNRIVAGMVLRGNQQFSEEDQNDKAFALGCELSSQSNFDYTTITSNFLTRDAKSVFELLSAAILKPKFEKDKVEQYVSYLVSYNTPAKMNIDALTQIYSAYCVHGNENPLGRSVYKQQLKQITPEKLKIFHEFNYTPKNTRLIICGNFDSGDIKAIVKKYFGDWESAYGEVNGVELETPVIRKKELFFVQRGATTQCALKWTKEAPGITHKDALAFNIANALFNQVLFKEIREKGGKTYSIGSGLNASKFSNLFSIDCSVRSEELLGTIELFDKTLSDFSLGNFSQRDFDNEITRFRTDMMDNEYPEEIAAFYSPLLYNFNERKKILDELAALGMKDVQKVIKRYFTPDHYKLVIAGDDNLVNKQLSKLKNLKRLKPEDLEYKSEK